MPVSPHDVSHLLALIEAARAEAERQGASAASRLLDDAAREARAAGPETGRPDEGIRLGDLTTDNDK